MIGTPIFWTRLKPKNLLFRAKKGFWPDALWSLDYTVAKFVLPRIKEFKYYTASHPPNLTQSQWFGIIESIEKAMTLHVKDMEGDILTQEQYAAVKHGTNLFGEYFLHLWS